MIYDLRMNAPLLFDKLGPCLAIFSNCLLCGIFFKAVPHDTSSLPWTRMASKTTRPPPMHCRLHCSRLDDADDDAVETVATLPADAGRFLLLESLTGCDATNEDRQCNVG
jgi:hypothetical protein